MSRTKVLLLGDGMGHGRAFVHGRKQIFHLIGAYSRVPNALWHVLMWLVVMRGLAVPGGGAAKTHDWVLLPWLCDVRFCPSHMGAGQKHFDRVAELLSRHCYQGSIKDP